MSGCLTRSTASSLLRRHWRWQRVFPAPTRWKSETTEGRRHYYETNVHRAVRATGIDKRASCHTFRHSFATRLLERGHDIRGVDHLIYTHVLRHEVFAARWIRHDDIAEHRSREGWTLDRKRSDRGAVDILVSPTASAAAASSLLSPPG